MATSQGGPSGDATGPDRAAARDARLAAAADQRRRTRFLTAQAAEDASVSGVLLDLAERADAVTVTSCLGHELHGRITALGVDFVTLTGPESEVVVMTAAIQSITVPVAATVTGDRFEALEVALVDVLVTMAPDRPEVEVRTVAGQAITGTLHAAGRDVVLIHRPDRQAAYVPIGAIAELEVRG